MSDYTHDNVDSSNADSSCGRARSQALLLKPQSAKLHTILPELRLQGLEAICGRVGVCRCPLRVGVPKPSAGHASACMSRGGTRFGQAAMPSQMLYINKPTPTGFTRRLYRAWLLSLAGRELLGGTLLLHPAPWYRLPPPAPRKEPAKQRCPLPAWGELPRLLSVRLTRAIMAKIVRELTGRFSGTRLFRPASRTVCLQHPTWCARANA